ncbi:hypothetical protein FQA39_LY12922 [Lamprigera yunnana]|nr:hypothetical protein FQA39_LY12922 [Lamprigera yunnana]
MEDITKDKTEEQGDNLTNYLKDKFPGVKNKDDNLKNAFLSDYVLNNPENNAFKLLTDKIAFNASNTIFDNGSAFKTAAITDQNRTIITNFVDTYKDALNSSDPQTAVKEQYELALTDPLNNKNNIIAIVDLANAMGVDNYFKTKKPVAVSDVVFKPADGGTLDLTKSISINDFISGSATQSTLNEQYKGFSKFLNEYVNGSTKDTNTNLTTFDTIFKGLEPDELIGQFFVSDENDSQLEVLIKLVTEQIKIENINPNYNFREKQSNSFAIIASTGALVIACDSGITRFGDKDIKLKDDIYNKVIAKALASDILTWLTRKKKLNNSLGLVNNDLEQQNEKEEPYQKLANDLMNDMTSTKFFNEYTASLTSGTSKD